MTKKLEDYLKSIKPPDLTFLEFKNNLANLASEFKVSLADVLNAKLRGCVSWESFKKWFKKEGLTE